MSKHRNDQDNRDKQDNNRDNEPFSEDEVLMACLGAMAVIVFLFGLPLLAVLQ